MKIGDKLITPVASKQAYWRGRTWTIAVLKKREFNSVVGPEYNADALIDSDGAVIVYPRTISNDLALVAILHEAFHEMFPEWKSEPCDESKSELGVGERDMKAFLEAFGVDLMPLLPERKKRPR